MKICLKTNQLIYCFEIIDSTVFIYHCCTCDECMWSIHFWYVFQVMCIMCLFCKMKSVLIMRFFVYWYLIRQGLSPYRLRYIQLWISIWFVILSCELVTSHIFPKLIFGNHQTPKHIHKPPPNFMCLGGETNFGRHPMYQRAFYLFFFILFEFSTSGKTLKRVFDGRSIILLQ